MNITQSFNNISSPYGPRKYSDLSYDIPNRVHKQLYEEAIRLLIADLDTYDLGDYGLDDDETWDDVILSIKEIPYNEYWIAPDVIITFKDYDDNGKPKFKKFKFDLAPYWKNCYNKYDNHPGDVKYDKNIPNDIEIVKYDYLRGKAIVRSKLEDIEYEVDFDELNMNIPESEDVRLPDDTFTNLRRINL